MTDFSFKAEIAARILDLAASNPKHPVAGLTPAQCDALASLVDKHHGISAAKGWEDGRLATYLASAAQSEPQMFKSANAKPVDLKLDAGQRLAQIENPDAFKIMPKVAPEPLTTAQLAALPPGPRLAALDGHRDVSLEKKKGIALPPGHTKESLAKMRPGDRLAAINGEPPPRMHPKDYQ